MVFKKGGKPWNNGLTKETDDRVKKGSEKLEGRVFSEKTIRKMSEAKKGSKLNKTHKKKISASMTYFLSKASKGEEWGKHFLIDGKTPMEIDEYRKRQLEATNTLEFCKARKESARKTWKDPNYRELMSLLRKAAWKDPEKREQWVKNILEATRRRPTGLENRFIEICKKHRLPFKYCGDGSLLIGFKNPDFVESNGRKICLEVFGNYWHESEDEKERIEHFAKHGWKCLVVWEDELNNEKSLMKRVGAIL